jgi:outer membrane protein assembly factor BamA
LERRDTDSAAAGVILLAVAVAVVASPQAALAEETNGAGAEWFLLGAPFYMPETGFGLGIAGGMNWRVEPESRPSNLLVGLAYTFRNQVILSAIDEWWLAGGDVRVWNVSVGYRYPDEFYGYGPDTRASDAEDYLFLGVTNEGGVEFALAQGLRAGPQIYYGYGEVSDVEEGGLLAAGSLPGVSPTHSVGVGATLAYDTRDAVFLPHQGVLLQAGGLAFPEELGSTSAYQKLTLDLRYYVRIWHEHVVAFQARAEHAFGAVPIREMPSIGGPNGLRGYRYPRHMDDVMAYAQAEYRFPIWKRLDGVAFGGAGNVAPSVDDLDPALTKWAAGGGLRYRITDEKLRARLDCATSAAGTEFYFTMAEAF